MYMARAHTQKTLIDYNSEHTVIEHSERTQRDHKKEHLLSVLCPQDAIVSRDRIVIRSLKRTLSERL